MKSNAKTVKAYLDSLPEERRRALAKVRTVMRKNLGKGFEEVMNWGMICYQVPLKTYPDTYNGQPLVYAALASQKNHMAVYLQGIYVSAATGKRFEKAYKATGKRFDVGKSCVRFRKLDDLPLELVGDYVGLFDAAEFVSATESVRGSARKARKKKSGGAKKKTKRGRTKSPRKTAK